jgi:hypothetical protein
MKGAGSKSLFYSQFPELSAWTYQCSSTTTDSEINKVFEDVERSQAASGPSERVCTVFLDEVGLAATPNNPLKVLNHWLDNPKVGFVAISNVQLDRARMNRGNVVQRSAPEGEDLEVLALGCVGLEPFSSAENKEAEQTLRNYISAFAKAYEKVRGYAVRGMDGASQENTSTRSSIPTVVAKADHFFGMRDFYQVLCSLPLSAISADLVVCISP